MIRNVLDNLIAINRSRILPQEQIPEARAPYDGVTKVVPEHNEEPFENPQEAKKHSSDPEAKKPSEVKDFSTDPAEQQEEVGEQEVMEPGLLLIQVLLNKKK
jgi:hypothetical protein